MNIVKKFALRKTRLHSDDTFDNKAYCKAGDIYYQIDNGTIGKGKRTYNMSEKAMESLINSEAFNWNKDGYISRSNYLKDNSNVIELNPSEKEEDNFIYNFTANDIPF